MISQRYAMAHAFSRFCGMLPDFAQRMRAGVKQSGRLGTESRERVVVDGSLAEHAHDQAVSDHTAVTAERQQRGLGQPGERLIALPFSGRPNTRGLA
jgi:hypothetical protein